jgi:chitooligosaccharide deacetylase
LTFDDGYAPERCLEIADILTEHAIPATWFPNGVHVRSSPAVWRSIARRFPIANHTLTHASLVDLPPKGIRHELLANQRTIERITGRPMSRLLRPSYGAYDGRVLRLARKLGYRVVMWNLSAADTSPKGTDRGIATRALQGGPGSIVLMHCGPDVTPRILPIVIARYACAGYRFATLDDLLAGGPGVAARVSCPPPRLPAAPRHTHEPAPDAKLPDVLSYDLGSASLLPSTSGADEDLAAVHLQGVMAVPPGDGPFPVAVLLHGSSPPCDAPVVGDGVEPDACPADDGLRRYDGLGDLAARLAARGYLSIVPDVSAEYAAGDGSTPIGARATAIVDAHLDALGAGLGFPADTAGKADLERLVLVGHDQGAPVAVHYATDAAATHPPRALGLLTPADAGVQATVPETMPLAVVIAECDAPDGGTAGPTDVAEQSSPSRPAPLLVHTLTGGTREAFSTQTDSTTSTSCASSDRMAPVKQRRITAAVLSELFDPAIAEAAP